MDDDADLESLLQGVVQLFDGNQKFNAPLPAVSTQPAGEPSTSEIQAPIKGTFYNSGNFSLSATDARHLTGHPGVDMRAPAGTPIYTITSGVVSNVGSSAKGGNFINISHANGLRSYYAHLGSVRVQKGDRVDNSTIIGTVGDSGNAAGTWPHLHFQIWKNDQIQNPANFFSVPPFSNVDKNKEQWWVSESAKAENKQFNMKQHLNDRRIAFSKEVNSLYKIADTFYRLAIR